MDVVASFSTELGNGDPSPAVGIAQEYFDGTPVVLNTPSIQTNFSPACLAYWTQVYLDIAALQNAAGLSLTCSPAKCSGGTFRHEHQHAVLRCLYSATIHCYLWGTHARILTNTADPASYPNEVAFLPMLIGAYT